MRRRKKAMMKIKSFYLIVLLLLSGQFFAQPLHGPCGGGLIIDNLYNKKLQRIDIATDKSIQIRNFILDGKKVLSETLPATLNLPSANRYSYQRMYIVYKQEAMVIDFIDVLREDFYDCIKNKMDSVVFQKGYFKYYGNKNSSKSDYSKGDRRGIGYRNIGKGLTLHNKKHLIKEGILEYSRSIDYSFLSNEDSSALIFFKRTKYYLEKNQTELALEELKKGIKKNKDQKNCEISYLLCDIYTKTAQFDKAIKSITKAINLNCRSDHNEYRYERNMYTNYRSRIGLFIKLKKYDKALQDYDTLSARFFKYDIYHDIYINRAKFKIKYLKDYAGTIDDLKKIIDKIKIDEYPNKVTLLHGSFSDHEIYTVLATAEYLNGDKKSAFRHWLKAEECGYWQLGYSPQGNYLDSIINQNPKISELFLARSLTNYAKKSFDNSLIDISKAEALGITDYRVNLYRAIILDELEKYDEALKEINLAILKDNQDPRCFWFRHLIRYHLGQIKEEDRFDHNDPDNKQYDILYKDWKWERY